MNRKNRPLRECCRGRSWGWEFHLWGDIGAFSFHMDMSPSFVALIMSNGISHHVRTKSRFTDLLLWNALVLTVG